MNLRDLLQRLRRTSPEGPILLSYEEHALLGQISDADLDVVHRLLVLASDATEHRYDPSVADKKQRPHMIALAIHRTQALQDIADTLTDPAAARSALAPQPCALVSDEGAGIQHPVPSRIPWSPALAAWLEAQPEPLAGHAELTAWLNARPDTRGGSNG